MLPSTKKTCRHLLLLLFALVGLWPRTSFRPCAPIRPVLMHFWAASLLGALERPHDQATN